MKRYIIDVTQLVHWPGNLTGIPRVMHELAIKFHTHNPKNTIFVSWVKEVGAMCEIDLEKTLENRGHGIVYKNSDNQAVTPAASSPANTAKKAIKKIASATNIESSKFYQKIKRKVHAEVAQSYKAYTPKKGDKLFIPWGEWWDGNWLGLMRDFNTKGVDLFPICHDILPMVVPQFSGNSASLQDFIREVFPVAKTVLVPSKNTRRDLAKWMKKQALELPPIEVFRLGEDFSATTPPESEQKAILKKYGVTSGNYLVFVSTVEPRKNHALLYYAYRLAASKKITLPKLLVIGRVGHDTSEILKLINEDPEVNSRISLCHNVSDSELQTLYHHCKFSLQPSFYEGWGMSVVESISKGKPVVCSNSSSLKEMPKEAVIFFNPNSADECLSAIQEMNNPENLQKYTAAAKKYKMHSWEDSFGQVLAIINGAK